MWSANLCAGLVLWGASMSVPPANAILLPDRSTIQLNWMYQDFMTKFNKTYPSENDTLYRFKVFVQNLARSWALQDTELGTAQYGVTPFSDLTESEFARMSGAPSLQAAPPTPRAPHHGLPELPRSCDWRKAGAVTAVKNQGNCGSCWAFATVSNIEALSNIHRSIQCNLSVQEVIDCTYPDKRGCKGGYVKDALQYILHSNGLSKSVLYPYVEKAQRCQKHRGRKLTKIDSFEVLPRDENDIAKTVASQGPVTALINKIVLQHYQKGIIQRSKEDCDPCWLDHAVLIAGFGEGKKRRGSWSGSYWIIQNSWGHRWGEEGYFRLHRGSNTCGISQSVMTATLTNLGKRKPAACPP